jgi:acyl carrier protein
MPESTADLLRRILATDLQLGDRAHRLSESDRLLGALPEFDSMAVLIVVGKIESELKLSIDDDELSADVFETLGSLAGFVDRIRTS